MKNNCKGFIKLSHEGQFVPEFLWPMLFCLSTLSLYCFIALNMFGWSQAAHGMKAMKTRLWIILWSEIQLSSSFRAITSTVSFRQSNSSPTAAKTSSSNIEENTISYIQSNPQEAEDLEDAMLAEAIKLSMEKPWGLERKIRVKKRWIS